MFDYDRYVNSFKKVNVMFEFVKNRVGKRGVKVLFVERFFLIGISDC